MKKIIIDTDIGMDIDDTWALLLFLSSTLYDVSLISITNGDIDYKTKLVAKILKELNMTHIPIAKGRSNEKDELIYPQKRWIEDFDMGDYEGVVYDSYEEAYQDVLGNSLSEYTVVSLAPYTSIVGVLDLLERHKCTVVSMAGSIYKGYLGHDYPEAECNIVSDIDAAHKILSSNIELVLLPLDVCRELLIKDENYQLIKNSNNISAKIAMDNYCVWQEDYVGGAIKFDYNTSTSIIYDLIAFWYLSFPQNFDVRYLTLAILEDGKTVVSDQGKKTLVALNMHKHGVMEQYSSEQLCTRREVNLDVRVMGIENKYKLIYPLRRNNIFLSVYETGWEHKKANSTYGPNIRDYYIMHLVTKGKGRLIIDKKVYEVEEGDCFIVPPNIMTSYTADAVDPFSYYWIGFGGIDALGLLTKAGFLSKDTYVIHPVHYDNILKRLINVTNVNSMDGTAEYVLIGELYLIFADMIKVSVKNNNEALYMEEAIRFVRDNYQKFITVSDIADYLGIDRTYLFRLFKKEINISPIDYLINLRIEKAKLMLINTNKPVKEIAQLIGYSSYTSFVRAFKNKCKILPNEYREKNKQ